MNAAELTEWIAAEQDLGRTRRVVEAMLRVVGDTAKGGAETASQGVGEP